MQEKFLKTKKRASEYQKRGIFGLSLPQGAAAALQEEQCKCAHRREKREKKTEVISNQLDCVYHTRLWTEVMNRFQTYCERIMNAKSDTIRACVCGTGRLEPASFVGKAASNSSIQDR